MIKMLLTVFLMCSTALTMGCTAYQRVMTGGMVTEMLPPGQKLMTAAWRGDNTLWVLTRPLHEGEALETYEFHELSNFDIAQGKVIIKEVR
jgi:hypothetical protein